MRGPQDSFASRSRSVKILINKNNIKIDFRLILKLKCTNFPKLGKEFPKFYFKRWKTGWG